MARPDLFARANALPAAATPPVLGRRDGTRVELDGRWLQGFCSTDHLGLSQHFGVINALQEGAARDGSGSTMSTQVGLPVLQQTLQAELAEWLQYPAAVVFASDLAATQTVQQVLLGEDGDLCVQDAANHAALGDASRLAGAHLRHYPHLDTEGAQRQLRGHAEGAALLATDALFDSLGDSAPLRALSLVARMEQALLYVDDTHGIGVVGEHGRGSVAAAGLGVEEVPLLKISLGHALGGSGAVVLGPAGLLQPMQAQTLHSSGLSGAQLGAAVEAVRLARREHWRRDKLEELISLFRERARLLGLPVGAAATATQVLIPDTAGSAPALAKALWTAGHQVAVVCPPRRRTDDARLQVRLSALHTTADIHALLDALAMARDQLPRPLGIDADALA